MDCPEPLTAFLCPRIVLHGKVILKYIRWSSAVPRRKLVDAGRNSLRLSIDTTACPKKGGINVLSIAMPWSVVIGAFLIRSFLIVIRSENELKYVIANFWRDAVEERRRNLRVDRSLGRFLDSRLHDVL